MGPRFFATPPEFRAWLEKHHATAKDLLVGFHKKGSGMASITGYRTAATYWVVSAKREETRRRRLATLIADSAHGRTVGPLTSPAKRR